MKSAIKTLEDKINGLKLELKICNQPRIFDPMIIRSCHKEMAEHTLALEVLKEYGPHKTGKEQKTPTATPPSSGLFDRNGKELKLGSRFRYHAHGGYYLHSFIGKVVFEEGAYCYIDEGQNLVVWPTAFISHDELKKDFLDFIEVLE